MKRMKITGSLKNKFENMKYRHKLTILLVTASLVPMILLVLYSHDRMSSLLREKEMEDMSFHSGTDRRGNRQPDRSFFQSSELSHLFPGY